MADYQAPLRDIRFILNEVFEIPKLWDSFDLLPSSLTVFSLVMFITAEDDEHEKAIFRRANHQYFEGSRSWPRGEGAVPQVQLVFIQPGNPQQNAYIERYNRTVRYDWLAQYLFHSIREVQEYATRWLWIYNNERPNMALGGITPQQKLAMAA